MSDTINKNLGQLEEDLKKLQAAREQVESVVASNQEFTTAVNSLVENTNLLVDKIRITTEGAVENFSKKLTESKNALDIVVEKSVGHIQDSVKTIEEGNLKLQDTIEAKVNEVSQLASSVIDKNIIQSRATIKDTSSLAVKSLEEQKSENLKMLNQIKQLIGQLLEESVSHIQDSVKTIEEGNLKLQDTIEAKVNEVSQLASSVIDKNVIQSRATIKDTSSLAVKSLEEQKSENLKTLNQILETHNQIKQLIGQLLDLDLPNALKTLNSNIEKQQQQNDRQFQTMKQIQIWSLIGTGVVAVMIIIFKYVL
jgi:hypothetical protein